MRHAKRIGIFGGAFDPPHLAHHALAQAALAQCQLDGLLILPTGEAWHKSRNLTPAHHRLAMARLAFQDLANVLVDARETQRPGPTYTVDTLTEVQQAHPDAQLFLFIGSDQAQAFRTWHQWQTILNLATVVEARRSSNPAPAPSGRSAAVQPVGGQAPPNTQWHNKDMAESVVSAVLHMPNMPCNATEIRASIAQGQPLTEWLSPSVWHYIAQHRLYQSTTPHPS